MKALIVYHSIYYHNTEKIALAIGDVLSAAVKRCDQIQPDEAMAYDLIGLGSGIYFSQHHKKLLSWVDALPPLMNKKAFIFSTRGAGPVWWYHRSLRQKLVRHECEIVAEFSCKAFDSFGILQWWGGINKGRPDESDLHRSKVFARSLTQSLYT